MKSPILFFVVLLTAILMIGSVSHAEDADALKNRFYGGLGAIIERYIDEPQRCVNEVDRYYEANRAMIKEIREWSGVVAARVSSSYSEFRSVSDSDIQGYQDDAMYAHERRQRATDGLTRYKEALQVFMEKYVIEGLQIIAKARLLRR